ncbi:hypothetical protein [Methanococcoides sp. NM1]|uniref:hypothetical protein n=1 Tax=Methanococcoides sp. NM1 TaxID=1201013 RepID=UPI001083BAAC|nr:hypothetical protein [Methanococcoides sp. NM1]
MNDKNNIVDIDKYSLLDLLEPDNAEILELESIEGKEDEYSMFLGTFEFTIAHYYHDNDKKITDKEVVNLLKDIKANLDKKMNYFQHLPGALLIENLIEIFDEENITVHEFNLVIDYVLEAVENRSWMSDRQAYLKWICYYIDITIEQEDQQYKKRVERLAKMYDIPPGAVDDLLEKSPDFVMGEAPDPLTLNSEFIAMNDDEKYEYLAENAPNDFNLFLAYLSELESNGNIDIAIKLAKRASKRFGEMFSLHLKIGEYFLHFDPNISKGYYNRAISSLEKVELIPDEMKKDIVESIKEDIRLCDKMLSEDDT